MNRQLLISTEPLNGTIFDFMEYKKKKPFFKHPMKISIGNTADDIYYMIKNFVYKGMQILALQKNIDCKTIILVEAKIEDGQLRYISMLPNEYIGAIGKMLEGII